MTDILLLDIRNHDEIDSIKYNIDYVEDEDVEIEDEENDKLQNNGKKNIEKITEILYIPSTSIKYNINFLNLHFQKYKMVYIICQSGNRSKIIKEKYFNDDKHIIINDIHFDKLNSDQVIKTSGIHMSITRKIQVISGSIIIFIFALSYKYSIAIYIYILLGLFMLYVGISGNCFMSSILTRNSF
jgi:rhodanese-related sulfurtransferase